MKDVAELLDLIAARAAGLRAAGVLSVTLPGGAGFVLAPAELEDDGDSATDQPEVEPDIMRSPWTHGQPARGAEQQPITVKRRPL